MSDSTAVATTTDEPMEAVQRAGAIARLQRAELKKLFTQIDGLTFGNVAGTSLSQTTKAVLAEFVAITGANLIRHVDLFGGKPYLNANYYTDKLNSDPFFVRYEQRDLSPSVEAAIRGRASSYRDRAEEAGEGHPTYARLCDTALDLDSEADDIALARQSWSPRENATVVVETTIYRFITAAPIERIKSGEIVDLDRYIIKVVECNHAGGMGDSMKRHKKWDPIGDANPGMTARTRSLRRASAKSFDAWHAKYEERIQKAEAILEAEWEVIDSDNQAAVASLPVAGGPQAISTGSGDPQAVNPAGAVELPVEGALPEPDEFDATDARKRYFATMKDAGIASRDRKKWAKKHDLPESTKEWGAVEYEKAQEAMVSPSRDRVMELLGGDVGALAELSLQVLGKDGPAYLKDWNALGMVLSARADDTDEAHDGGDL